MKSSPSRSLTVFGASGKVGRQVVAGALADGYVVRAFVHRRPLSIHHRNLTSAKGDINDPKSAAAAITGSEAVLSCLSSWGSPKKDVLSTAMAAIIPAMQEAGVQRIVSLTGSDARDVTDHPALINRLSHAALGSLRRTFSGTESSISRCCVPARSIGRWYVRRPCSADRGAAITTSHCRLAVHSPLSGGRMWRSPCSPSSPTLRFTGKRRSFTAVNGS